MVSGAPLGALEKKLKTFVDRPNTLTRSDRALAGGLGRRGVGSALRLGVPTHRAPRAPTRARASRAPDQRALRTASARGRGGGRAAPALSPRSERPPASSRADDRARPTGRHGPTVTLAHSEHRCWEVTRVSWSRRHPGSTLLVRPALRALDRVRLLDGRAPSHSHSLTTTVPRTDPHAGRARAPARLAEFEIERAGRCASLSRSTPRRRCERWPLADSPARRARVAAQPSSTARLSTARRLPTARRRGRPQSRSCVLFSEARL